MSTEDREIARDLAADLPTTKDVELSRAAERAAIRGGYAPTLTVIDGTTPQKPELYPAPSDPTAVARRLLTDLWSEQEQPTIRFWRGDWYVWLGPAWEKRTGDEIERIVWLHLDGQMCEVKGEETDWCPVDYKISNVLRAMRHLTSLPDRSEAPMWTTPFRSEAPADLIGMDNGLLAWRTGELLDHTPELFNVYALDFAFNPDATCPTFDAFMASTFQHDPQAILTLQEWFGYIISGRTDLQKSLLMWGPPRSGKGTLTHILEALIGTENAAGIDMHSLSGEFGLSSLLGTSLATLGDVRADRLDGGRSVERLLGIIGSDKVTVNRKGQSFWTGVLPVRFMLTTNVLPSFRDHSAAIVSRFLLVEMKTSHLGAEDIHLSQRLTAELPGILIWALAGLERLTEQGRFTIAGSDADNRADMADAASPLRMFLRETYEITGNAEHKLDIREVVSAYKPWAEEGGYAPMSRSTLVPSLKAAGVDGVTVTRVSRAEDPARPTVITGVRKRTTTAIDKQSPIWDDTTDYIA